MSCEGDARNPQTGSVSTRRPSISISIVECPSQVPRNPDPGRFSHVSIGLSDGNGPWGTRRSPPHKNSLAVGELALGSMSLGSTGGILRNDSPAHRGEALMRSRRKPLGFLPNAFMATLGFSLRCKNSDRVDLARRNPPQGIIDKAEWVEPERQTWAQTALIVLRWSAQVARNESAQLGAKPRCTLAAEGPFKLILRLFPQLCRSAKPFHAGLGEVQLLAAPVSCAVLDADETVALQRQHGAAQCGAIHDQLTGKSIDGHGPEPFQLGQDRKLCGAQSYCREVLVIELSDMTRGLPQSQAVAGMGEHRSVGGHGVSGGP